jgi:glycosyltransferase involved in cell wall biosynthesis
MISVIIPVFNTNPEWLKDSVNSILNQTFQDFEILLIDDNSTEISTIKELNLLDTLENVEVIRLEKNLGISGALNIGIRESKYDIIARMDSDDISHPERFEKQIKYLEENPEVDLVGTNLIYYRFHENEWKITNEGTLHPLEITKDTGKNSLWFLNHPTVMFKKESIISVGGYDEELRGLAEDYELWIRMLRNNKILRNIEDHLLLLRINPNSLVQNINNENQKFQLELQKTL